MRAGPAPRRRSGRRALLQVLAPTALLGLLAGCMNMSGLDGGSKYACAAPEGVACDSVSGTYANAVHNNLPSQRRAGAGRGGAASGAAPADTPPPRQPSTMALAPVSGSSADVDTATGTAPAAPLALRTEGRVLRLWTKAWEDVDGDLWDQGYLYVQVSAGQWQIDHVRQRIRDRYAPLRPPPQVPGSTTGSPPGSDPDAADTPGSTPGRPQTPSALFPSLMPPSGRGDPRMP